MGVFLTGFTGFTEIPDFACPPLKKRGKLPKAVELGIVNLLKTQINLWWLSDLLEQSG